MVLKSKNLLRPDESIAFDRVVEDIVELGDLTVGRVSSEPGWRWSTHVRPHVGGEWCQARHVGFVLSGRLGVDFPDGTSWSLNPNDVYDISPGHDGYTIGDETCVLIEWSGIRAFAGFRAGVGRTLATLLFTDLVASTEIVRRLGDVAWREMLSGHFEGARAELERYRGREIKTAGDGMLAAFDGPALALSCATAISRIATRDGLSIRAGVHVGEVEQVGTDIRGLAVHETARIMAQAEGSEILVSDLTRTLAASSGFRFDDRGLHILKGVGGEWRLFALAL